MALKDDLENEVATIFRATWSKRDGYVVPESDDLQLGNDGVKLSAAVMYADMADSTQLVDAHTPEFAAEIYKVYLHCAAKIVRAGGGSITAYDGDRIMAVFIGEDKETAATRAAMKIECARTTIIQPALKAQYPNRQYVVRHHTGVDASDLFVARTGIRGSNDLVWVGRAANHAAKLTALSADYPTWITDAVYQKLPENLRSVGGKAVWEARSWTDMDKARIYRSTWHVSI